MKLEKLLQNVNVIKTNIDMELVVGKIVTDSKQCDKNDVFVAINGNNNNGNNFINDAISQGAVVVITEQKPYDYIPYVLVDDIRKTLALLAVNYYDNPSKDMKKIAVVGTNGKTTTARMIYNILHCLGKKAVVIGTIGAEIDGEPIDCGLTTPDPIEFNRLVYIAKQKRCEYLITEVSAHAIYYKKTNGIIFDECIFTNFSEDHLDFFGDMDSYKKVKKSFFTNANIKHAIINTDDAVGREIISTIGDEIPVSTYGIYNPSDTFAMDIIYKKSGTRAWINSNDEVTELSNRFLGECNVYNALACFSALQNIGIKIDDISKFFTSMKEIDGRFNVISSKKQAIIDFAHTPDGLEKLLKTIKQFVKGRIILVFGCGGNRDKNKRRIMGQIAGKYADFTVITSDNPRNENPNHIIEEIKQGFIEVSNNYICIAERENAITYALILAKDEDYVVIAGKGNEKYIEENGIKRDYSDKKTVEEIFRRYNL